MFKLKDFRIANDLKQSDLQDVLGCKQSFISRVENGREAFPANFIQKLIEVYGNDKVVPYIDDTNNEQTSSKEVVPSEFIEALFEERKRHDEMNAEFLRQNAELIRQNASLIRLLEEKEKTVVQTEAVRSVVKSKAGLQE